MQNEGEKENIYEDFSLPRHCQKPYTLLNALDHFFNPVLSADWTVINCASSIFKMMFKKIYPETQESSRVVKKKVKMVAVTM